MGGMEEWKRRVASRHVMKESTVDSERRGKFDPVRYSRSKKGEETFSISHIIVPGAARL